MFGVPLHFLFVHFPIALALLAVVCDLRRQHETAYQLTLWAAGGGALAVMTGMQISGGVFEGGISILHVLSAFLGTFGLVALGVLRYSAKARNDEETWEGYPKVWLVLGISAATAIAIAAVTGHRFVLGQ